MPGIICGKLVDSKSPEGLHGGFAHTRVSLHSGLPCTDENMIYSAPTDEKGNFEFETVDEGTYYVQSTAFGLSPVSERVSLRKQDRRGRVELGLPLGLSIELRTATSDDNRMEVTRQAVSGRLLLAVAKNIGTPLKQPITRFQYIVLPDATPLPTTSTGEVELRFAEPGPKTIELRAFDPTHQGGGHPPYAFATMQVQAAEPDRQMIGGNIGVRLERTRVYPTRDQALWVAIRNRTHAIGFHRYSTFINRVLQSEENARVDNPAIERKLSELGTSLHGVGAYDVLKVATEAFLLIECGIRIEEDSEPNRSFFNAEFETARLGEPVSIDYVRAKLREYLGSPPQLPYITRVIEAAFPEWRTGTVGCNRVLTGGINEPCLIELIWSYWHEEGMLSQTMNAITRRFQNVRNSGERDPLSYLEIDPLRPMNNIIWGLIQDEIRRLSVKRRAYEYEHQYGLRLYGSAVRDMRPADSRSKFLEGFHNLLHLCSVFFKEDNDTTVIADGYPLLNALKEVNLLLAQGAQNQYGDLPWTARAEMLLQQYILSRPELRDFLQSRAMVPYKEAWMPQVDTMKTLQGWSDVTVTHFRDLGVYGEQILLSVRFGDWIAINDEDSAKNWARYWRPEIQGYLHAYRAATGIDLTNADTVDATVPAVLLQKRLVLQQQRTR